MAFFCEGEDKYTKRRNVNYNKVKLEWGMLPVAEFTGLTIKVGQIHSMLFYTELVHD